MRDTGQGMYAGAGSGAAVGESALSSIHDWLASLSFSAVEREKRKKRRRKGVLAVRVGHSIIRPGAAGVELEICR